MSNTIEVVFEKLDEKAEIPKLATKGSAGADLKACIDEPIVIRKNSRELVPTGLKMRLPEGYEAQIRPRSGLALKQGITVLNAPGTIDSDYRGPVGVVLFNTTSADFKVENGDRIAQMVISEVPSVEFKEGKVDDDTERGEGGFGHTGKK